MAVTTVAMICALVIGAKDASVKTAGAEEEGGWNLFSNGIVGEWLKFPRKGRYRISVEARGDSAAGEAPVMLLRAGARRLGRWSVGAKWKTYRVETEIEAGTRILFVAFVNDYCRRGQDRNLHLRRIVVEGLDGAPEAVVVGEPDWRKDADERIERIRKGALTVRVLDADGRPVAGARVRVRQKRHEFAFGTAVACRMFLPDEKLGGRAEVAKRYRRILLENFNCVVTENAFKWHQMERQRNRPDYEAVDATLKWCAEHGMAARGHCIFWADDRYVPAWAKRLEKDELKKAVGRRISRDLGRYKGRFAEYDVCNEMIQNHFFERRLGFAARVEMFKSAKEADPKARLFLNEYGVLGGRFLEKYERLIEALRKAGAPVGGIGCQGHFRGRIPPVWMIKNSLDRLARFGLPIRITEFDIDTADQKSKARCLEDFYRVCFSHPAVDGILMWGFWEGRHWCPRAAPWNKNFQPTPAAETYRRLLFEEWWTKADGRTDEHGVYTTRAFFGVHLVEAGAPDGRKGSTTVTLSGSDGKAEVTVTLEKSGE